MHALAYWLGNDGGHISRIEIVFPVRGHSRLPPDRVFGRVEQELRRKKDINLPSDYNNVYEQHGLVRQLGRDWQIRAFKEFSKSMCDISGIQNMKRVILKKDKASTVLFKMEVNYFSSDNSKKFLNIMKKKTRSTIRTVMLPPVVSNRIPLQTATKNDLQYLLSSRFGDDWASNSALRYYVDVLAVEGSEEGLEECDYTDCVCLDEDPCSV